MWQPSASLQHVQQRAEILRQVRAFFAARGVMEVETPLACRHSVTAPYIVSIPATVQGQVYYLQTSPEYAMKRLLAAGSGPIYQICKAFRQEECGRYHHPEFTILEWYRPGFTPRQLMAEIDTLLQLILSAPPATYFTYQAVFAEHLALNPHQATLLELQQCARENGLNVVEPLERDDWLQLLMSHCIEPQIGKAAPCFIYDFPASQAALAKVRPENPPVASRFELYWQGVELANGFHELQNATEQRQRFEADLRKRAQAGLPSMPIDEFFLAALAHGLPDCTGVALGFDRLLMLATQSTRIEEVLSFDFARI